MVSDSGAAGRGPQQDGGLTTTVTGPKHWATGAPAIASSITRSVGAMGVRRAAMALTVINQPNGFDCPGCAWPEPPPGQRHRVEFCESGAKAVAEEEPSVGSERLFSQSIPLSRSARNRTGGSASRVVSPSR